MFYDFAFIFFVVIGIIILIVTVEMFSTYKRKKASETKKTKEYRPIPIIRPTKEFTLEDRYKAWGMELPSSFR